MKTKSLIISIFMVCASVLSVSAAKKSVTGTVTCEGKGIAGVVVTDGVNITKTDAKGAYALPTKVKDPHCQFVHISIPSGYEVERIGNAPQFYKRVDPKAKKQSFDFKLTKVDQSVYSVLTIADSHVCGGVNKRSHKDDRERYLSTLVPALKERAAQCEGRVYLLSLGDMTQTASRPGWKGRTTGYSMKMYMEDTDVNFPIFNAVGNHDHNHAPKGEYFNDETVYQSRADYHRDLGPEYYSFTLGREHYVVLDNSFILTKDSGPTTKEGAVKGYQIRLCNYQNEWLKKDIAALDPSKVDRIIVAAHCGIFGYSGKFNMMYAEEFLKTFANYEVICLVGHHHAEHIVKKKIDNRWVYQFMHSSAAGTAWYTYDNCEGAPATIADYTFKNGKVSRTLVPYGDNKGLTYRVYDNADHKWHYPITARTGTKSKYETEKVEATAEDKPAILVNIWGAYSCKFTENTGGKGKSTKRCYDLNYRDWYWNALNRSEAGEIPVGERLYKANWQEPKRGYHIWRYVPADAEATIHVVAKDAFGNIVAEFDTKAK
ncbi:MAG: calcineurin-like phosphoesterase C-terminal domain-containing protein [Alistipes sp.]|nr:calcineurin-like phosphoesterase C-terminal domain-containing protein [Alistipes sp.]